MNEYDLFDAMNGIDDDLLLRSEGRAIRKFPIHKVLIAAAAVILLLILVLGGGDQPHQYFFHIDLCGHNHHRTCLP